LSAWEKESTTGETGRELEKNGIVSFNHLTFWAQTQPVRHKRRNQRFPTSSALSSGVASRQIVLACRPDEVTKKIIFT
jgi:hypothetical protein